MSQSISGRKKDNAKLKNSKCKKATLLATMSFAFCFLAVTTISADKALADSPDPIFQENFDSLDKVIANGATLHDNLTFEAGKDGNGVHISGNANLSYPASGHFNFQKGTMEFWVKPDWDGRNLLSSSKYFMQVNWNSTQKFFLPVYASASKVNINSNYLYPSFFGTGIPANARVSTQEPFSVMTWKPGEWHKVFVYWDFTLPDDSDGTHRSYVVGKVDDKYTKLEKIAPPEIGANSPDAKIVIGCDSTAGRTPAEASFDNLKIYDHSLLPVLPFPAFKFNPNDPASIASFRQLFANDGFCSPFETNNNMPADCSKLDNSVKPGQNLLFFQKSPLEQVVENTIPKSEEIKSAMDYQSAQNQFEDLFFNTYSRTDLNNVRVTMSAFSGPDGATISKDNLDLRVVKNWFQAGVGTAPDQLPRYVPELLLYNDQVSYETDSSLINGATPDIPKLDHVETKIDQNTSKQFVILTHVPKETPPGTYTATVTLKADGVPDQTLALHLEVLPFELKETDKKIMASDWQLSAFSTAGKTTQDLVNAFKAYYQALKDHGFNGVDVGTHIDYRYSKFGTLMELFKIRLQVMRDLGFKNVILNEFYNPETFAQDITPEYKETMEQYGFEPWFYGVDEFTSDANVADQIKKNGVIHGIGGKSVSTTFLDPSAIDNMSDPMDWIIYSNWRGTYLPDLMAGRSTKPTSRLESYYWQGEDENPWKNRYNLGYLLWNTHLDGAHPWGYLYTSYGTYYNDFNQACSSPPCSRSDTMAYPSKQGPVPTMEFEAAKEGINDLRYLETWKNYKDIVAKKDSSAAQASEAVVNEILDRYAYKDPVSVTAGPPGFQVPMSRYEADRKTMTAEIVKLQAAAGPQYDSDLNVDSKIDLGDFNILKTDFLKLTANLTNLRSDINRDGRCTVRDAGIMMSGWKP